MKNAAEKMPCKIRGIDDFICDIMMSEALLSQFPISDLTGDKYPLDRPAYPYVCGNQSPACVRRILYPLSRHAGSLRQALPEEFLCPPEQYS